MKRTSGGNLLLVANFPSDTGYAWWLMEHFWKRLAQSFLDAGGQAFLAYPRITREPTHLHEAGIKTVELRLPWTNRDEQKAALQFLKERQISTVYFTDKPWYDRRYALIRTAGVSRILLHDHAPGDLPPSTGLRGAIKAIRHRIQPFCADYIFCVSELMSERARTAKRIPAERVRTVQNGVPPLSIDEATLPLRRRELRREWGAGSDTFIVITTGRAHPYKRFDFVIDTAAHVVEKRPDLDLLFVLVGDGPALEELKERVAHHGLTRRVALLGFQPNVRELLPSADVAMHAALGEGFSLSIVEYMTAQLPVLVPDIPSVCQAIEDGVSGYIYQRDSVAAAAEAIIQLAEQPELRRRMGAAARRVASGQYSLSRCTAEFDEAVAHALARDRAPTQPGHYTPQA